MTFKPKGNKTQQSALNFCPTCSFSLFTLSSSIFKLEKDAVCWKIKKQNRQGHMLLLFCISQRMASSLWQEHENKASLLLCNKRNHSLKHPCVSAADWARMKTEKLRLDNEFNMTWKLQVNSCGCVLRRFSSSLDYYICT